MKLGAWLWGIALILVTIASAEGWIVRVSPILIAVPAVLFAVGAGAFCIGRPGLATLNRILSCVFAGLLALVAISQVPLRAMFLASRDDLESIAQKVRGGTPCGCQSAGSFELSASQVTPEGNICLWVTSNPVERIGFVKTSTRRILGARYEIDLGGGWHYARFKDE